MAALLFALWLVLATGGAFAQTAAASDADTDTALDRIRLQVDAAQKALGAPISDADLLRLRQTAIAAQTQASGIATDLAPKLAGIAARLTELGTPTPGTKEDADIARQRAQLDKSRAAIDAELKLARLLAVESEQLAGQTWTLRRSQFQARLGERTTSILAPSFWIELRDDAPGDATRLAALGREFAAAAGATAWWAWVLVAGVAAGLWLARGAIERRLGGMIAARVPAGRLRRSLYAFVVVALWTLVLGAIAELFRSALGRDRALSPTTAALLDRIVQMIWLAGYLAGLLRALISARRPSWRLAPLPDAVALRLRRVPWQLALVSVVARAAESLASLLNASLAMTVAVNCFVACGMALALGVGVTRAEHLWQRELAREGTPYRPLWLTLVAVLARLILIGAFVSVLAGYVAFGSFAVKQVFWTAIVAGSAYLLACLTDDALMTWLASRRSADADADADADAPAGAHASALPGFARTRNQAAVLLSGLLRVVLCLVAVMLVLAPFGDGPTELLRRTGELPHGLSIGEVEIRPAALLQAALVLVLGVAAVRLLRRWLTERYLPTTTLDAGMRVSTTTLIGYAGIVTAVGLAMSAIGIGLERVAWVASALSVGIGFGLQAVVQNFVSGLILLAERPVKVGDWVSLGGVEGDIRRINVRATEIQMGDRSTVIVPNSEFITKVVRNVTWSDPLGLVQVKLPVPLGSNVNQVRDLLLAAFTAQEDVLAEPAPNVLLDAVDNGFLQFNATGFVNSPRIVGNVRSALLFDVLARLAAADITLAKPPTMLLGTPGGVGGVGGLPAPGTAAGVPAGPPAPGLAEPAPAAMPVSRA